MAPMVTIDIKSIPRELLEKAWRDVEKNKGTKKDKKKGA